MPFVLLPKSLTPWRTAIHTLLRAIPNSIALDECRNPVELPGRKCEHTIGFVEHEAEPPQKRSHPPMRDWAVIFATVCGHERLDDRGKGDPFARVVAK
jgi:hypothetical protein